MASSVPTFTPVKNKAMITLCVMLSTIMEVIDTTIANVALPHMQGGLGASQEQITWVLTSYIVSSAVAMPITGWLVSNLGIKKVLIACTAGFTVASMLCGIASSLEQMVLYRLLQGICGAALVPLSQSILFSINPPEKHGQAMAIWGIGIMVAPILGPVLGGYITENYNWRWIFFINLPVGILTLIGLTIFLPKDFPKKNKFDVTGFLLFSVFIMALQLFLDRGEQKDWLESPEIVTYIIISFFCFIFFIISSFKREQAFIPLEIFKDPNFTASSILMFIVGSILMSSVSIMPQFLQTLVGYNVLDAGILTAPRGLGVMISMAVVGKQIGKIDSRILLSFGIFMISFSAFIMTSFTVDVSKQSLVIAGIAQGFGLGFLFVPLSTIALSTLSDTVRPQASALFSLIRSIGGAIGISILSFSISYNAKLNHAILTEYIKPNSKNIATYFSNFTVPNKTLKLAVIEGVLTKEAYLISYINAFKLSMWMSLAAFPFVFLIRPTKIKKGEQIAMH